jgi:hypothetical protein
MGIGTRCTHFAIKDGKAYRIAGSNIDITDRKLKKNSETNERLTFHFMQAPLGYIEWNENSK